MSLTPDCSERYSDLGKRRAAVEGDVDAAVLTRGEDVAEDADQYVLRIFGIDQYARDAAGAGKAQARPSPAAVDRMVESAFGNYVVARIRFAAAGPHRAIVAGVDRDRTDRCETDAIGDVLPRRAAVGRFPNAAAGGTGVVEQRIGIASRNGALPGPREAPDRESASASARSAVRRPRKRAAQAGPPAPRGRSRRAAPLIYDPWSWTTLPSTFTCNCRSLVCAANHLPPTFFHVSCDFSVSTRSCFPSGA